MPNNDLPAAAASSTTKSPSASPTRLPKAASHSGPAGLKCSAGFLISDIALPGWTQIFAGAGVGTPIGRALFVVIGGVFTYLSSAGPARISR